MTSIPQERRDLGLIVAIFTGLLIVIATLVTAVIVGEQRNERSGSEPQATSETTRTDAGGPVAGLDRPERSDARSPVVERS